VAPRNPLEEMLGEIWGQTLGTGRIGVHDDFFELGGHSLMAVRLLAQVEDVFGLRLQVRAMFDSPTVAGMAETIAGELARLAGEETLEQVLAE
jgi:acyl carrier protein